MNGDQQIEAPANARPISRPDPLARRCGTLPGLGAGTGSATPNVPDNSTPEAQDFQNYADCLDKARPEDTEALQRCADLLQRP